MSYDKGVHLLPRQIARLCYKAGWIDAKNLAIAVAVVIAESNGYTKRRGPEHADGTYGNTDGSYDRGLWQINSKAHPSMTDAMCDDPVKATAYARRLYEDRGSTFRAWAAYTSGRYKTPKTFAYAVGGVYNFLNEEFGLPLR